MCLKWWEKNLDHLDGWKNPESCEHEKLTEVIALAFFEKTCQLSSHIKGVKELASHSTEPCLDLKAKLPAKPAARLTYLDVLETSANVACNCLTFFSNTLQFC